MIGVDYHVSIGIPGDIGDFRGLPSPNDSVDLQGSDSGLFAQTGDSILRGMDIEHEALLPVFLIITFPVSFFYGHVNDTADNHVGHAAAGQIDYGLLPAFEGKEALSDSWRYYAAGRFYGKFPEGKFIVLSTVLYGADQPVIVLSRQEIHAELTGTFYVLIGVGIGALIHNWIPDDVITTVLGSKNPFSVMIATIIGVPMYADIFGTLPITEALVAKGVGIGTALSFMMAVTALSLPSIIMLKKVIKTKLLMIFVGIVTVGIIIIGYIFNALGYLLI
jgi:hypothetical protein